MVVEQRTYQQPSAGNLVRQLIGNLNNLLTQHVELFRYEIKEDAEIATKTAVAAVTGALIAYTSLIFFGFFLIFFLALFMPLWMSALAVTLLFLVITAITIIVIKRYLRKVREVNKSVADETRKTVEDAQKWLQELK